MSKLYANEAAKLRDELAAAREATGKASCLGPAGSFSERAAQHLCAGYELVLCGSFGEVVSLLTSGETDYAVLPVENSLNGGVLPVLDLIANAGIFGEEEDLGIIDHRLALREGVKEADINVICSHEQALGQCAEYLSKHFPNARVVETASTAESLDRLDGHTAGIVGSHLRREGVVLSEENIADNKGNYTRFLLVEKRKALPERSVMVFFSAVCPHKPGSLVSLLKIFQRHSLNLTRIQSRPVKEEFGQYRFFIEIAGDIGSDRVKTALAEAKRCCASFKLLGAYT